MTDNLHQLAGEMVALFRQAVPLANAEVDAIIQSAERDTHRIEHQLDQHHRMEGENPPIGIVICRSKTRTMVAYALRTMTRPLGIATYTVTPQLPANFQGELPSPEQIAERLAGWARDSVEFDGEGV
jgi:hypothetical protein